MEILGNNLGAKKGKKNIIAKNVSLPALKNIIGNDIYPHQNIPRKYLDIILGQKGQLRKYMNIYVNIVIKNIRPIVVYGNIRKNVYKLTKLK